MKHAMTAKEIELEFHHWLKRTGDNFTAFPWENPNAYAAWAAQTYFYVKHTTTMITMCAAAFGTKDPEGFSASLGHLAEERGHDLLLLNDLDELGYSIADYKESAQTGLFHQNQYYMIQNEGPTAHLGYALLLEAMCAHFGRDVYSRVCKSHGKLAATFLDVHVIADQSHSEAGFREFAALDQTTALKVLKNVQQSAYLYEQILNFAAHAEAPNSYTLSAAA